MALDVTHEVESSFTSLQCVESVHVERDQHRDHVLNVQVHLKDFTREARRGVFAKERFLLDEFPSVQFNFDVVDASQQCCTADAPLGI